MRAARIENGFVADLWEVPSLDAFEGMQLVEVPDSVEMGAAYDGVAFVNPAPAPPTIPKFVTRRQARQALLLAGKLGLVQPAIDAIPDATQRGMMQIEWDDAQEFERNRPSLIAIGGAIGLDAAGIDTLFARAAAL